MLSSTTTMCLFLLFSVAMAETPLDVDKMRVRELKRMLRERDEPCVGCIEKVDFVKAVRNVLLRETPEAQRQAAEEWKAKELKKQRKEQRKEVAEANSDATINNAWRASKAAKKVKELKERLVAAEAIQDYSELKSSQPDSIKTLMSAYKTVQDALGEFALPDDEIRYLLRAKMRAE